MPFSDTPVRPPPARVLRDRGHETVLRPALGLTLYLDEPKRWISGLAAEAFSVFLEIAPRDSLRWFWTSATGEWHPFARNGRDIVREGLSPSGMHMPRHLLRVCVVDEAAAPSVSFTYREVEERGSGCTGYLEMILPFETQPALLTRIATWAMKRWPLWSGVGGYVVSWNRFQRPTVAHDLYPLLRRYIGFDVQDADAMSWKARTALPGTNWLTLIGEPLAAVLGIELAEWEARAWSLGTERFRGERALLLQAGAEPTIGDLNSLTAPQAYAEVNAAFAPHLVADPPPIFRRKLEPDNGFLKSWFNRFQDPEGWA